MNKETEQFLKELEVLKELAKETLFDFIPESFDDTLIYSSGEYRSFTEQSKSSKQIKTPISLLDEHCHTIQVGCNDEDYNTDSLGVFYSMFSVPLLFIPTHCFSYKVCEKYNLLLEVGLQTGAIKKFPITFASRNVITEIDAIQSFITCDVEYVTCLDFNYPLYSLNKNYFNKGISKLLTALKKRGYGVNLGRIGICKSFKTIRKIISAQIDNVYTTTNPAALAILRSIALLKFCDWSCANSVPLEKLCISASNQSDIFEDSKLSLKDLEIIDLVVSNLDYEFSMFKEISDISKFLDSKLTRDKPYLQYRGKSIKTKIELLAQYLAEHKADRDSTASLTENGELIDLYSRDEEIKWLHKIADYLG